MAFFRTSSGFGRISSLLLGARYDWQSALDDRMDFAPRTSLAFAPGKQKTVFRAGAGIFYDRLPASVIDRAMLFQGLRMQEVVILDPPYPDPFATGANPPPSFLPRFSRHAGTLSPGRKSGYRTATLEGGSAYRGGANLPRGAPVPLT